MQKQELRLHSLLFRKKVCLQHKKEIESLSVSTLFSCCRRILLIPLNQMLMVSVSLRILCSNSPKLENGLKYFDIPHVEPLTLVFSKPSSWQYKSSWLTKLEMAFAFPGMFGPTRVSRWISIFILMIQRLFLVCPNDSSGQLHLLTNEGHWRCSFRLDCATYFEALPKYHILQLDAETEEVWMLFHTNW